MTHWKKRACRSVLNPCSFEGCRSCLLPLPSCLSVHITQAASSQPLPTCLAGPEYTKGQRVSENEHVLLWDCVALPGCHRSAGRNSSLPSQEPRAGWQKGGLPGWPLGRGLPAAQPAPLLGLAPLSPVLFPHVHLPVRSRAVTCGSKGGAHHR